MLRIAIVLVLLAAPPARAEDPRVSFARGKALLAEGEENAARSAFLRAAEAAPTWLLPQLELGELAVRRREGVAEARAALAALADGGVTNPRYHRVLGDLAELEGDDAAAVTAWRASLERLPEQVEVRLRMAAALERRGRHAEAAEAYAVALARNPSDLVVRARYASALEASGAWEEAREQLGILVRLQPGKEIPLRRLARFHERRGELDEARRLHQEADRAGRRGEPPRKMRPLPPSRR